jgi:multimeric flavodoxin WrbA
MSSRDWDFGGLRALFINCTLKRSPEVSNTQALVDASRSIMQSHGVSTESLRLIDHDVATGVWPDMTEHGWASDAWPQIQDKVFGPDILVVAGPIWLGDNSSITKQCIEQLYASSHLLNPAGQYAYYGRVAGCLITGNEDGIKHCAMDILYKPATPSLPRPTPAGSARRDRPVLPRPRLRRTRQRLHQPQHHLHDLEPHAPGQDDQVGWLPGVRQSAHGVGQRRTLRLATTGVHPHVAPPVAVGVADCRRLRRLRPTRAGPVRS